MVGNLVQIQDKLKDLSDNQLRDVFSKGTVPQFLVMTEMGRRKEMKEEYQKNQAQAASTVAEDILNPATNMAQGLGALARPQNRMATQPQNLPIEQSMTTMAPSPQPMANKLPVTRMADGGLAKIKAQDGISFNRDNFFTRGVFDPQKFAAKFYDPSYIGSRYARFSPAATERSPSFRAATAMDRLFPQQPNDPLYDRRGRREAVDSLQRYLRDPNAYRQAILEAQNKAAAASIRNIAPSANREDYGSLGDGSPKLDSRSMVDFANMETRQIMKEIQGGRVNPEILEMAKQNLLMNPDYANNPNNITSASLASAINTLANKGQGDLVSSSNNAATPPVQDNETVFKEVPLERGKEDAARLLAEGKKAAVDAVDVASLLKKSEDAVAGTGTSTNFDPFAQRIAKIKGEQFVAPKMNPAFLTARGAADTALAEAQANLTADSAYKDLATALGARKDDIGGQRDEAAGLALLEAALRVAGTKSPYIGQAIGEAAPAIATYGKSLSEVRKQENALFDAEAKLTQLEVAEKAGRKDEVRKLRSEIRDLDKVQRDINEKAFNRFKTTQELNLRLVTAEQNLATAKTAEEREKARIALAKAKDAREQNSLANQLGETQANITEIDEILSSGKSAAGQPLTQPEITALENRKKQLEGQRSEISGVIKETKGSDLMTSLRNQQLVKDYNNQIAAIEKATGGLTLENYIKTQKAKGITESAARTEYARLERQKALYRKEIDRILGRIPNAGAPVGDPPATKTIRYDKTGKRIN